jgi:hypothetical protein
MTSKSPPIPPEQRPLRGERPDVSGGQRDRRDARTGLQSGQPGDADANLSQQGRFGNIKQNLTPQKSVQDR